MSRLYLVTCLFNSYAEHVMRNAGLDEAQAEIKTAAAAAAKSLQSCATLCNPIDGSPPGSTVPGNQDYQEKISVTSDMQMTPPLWQKVNKN